MNAATQNTARLIRQIRREEERAARQRAESSLVRSKLVQELVAAAGSQQAAADALGVSRQAISKASQAGEDAWTELQDRTAPALTYLPMTWPRFGRDALREEEWAALDGEEAAQAAEATLASWDTLAHTLTNLRELIQKAIRELTGILNGTDELEDVLAEGLKPGGGDLREWDCELVGRWLRPRTLDEAKQIRSVLMGIESGLYTGAREAREQRDVWAPRTGQSQD